MKAPADGALISNRESLRLWMTGVPVARCLGVSRRCVEGPYQDCGTSGASVNQALRIVAFRWLDPWDASHSAAESGHQLAQPAGLGRHHRAVAALEAGRTRGDKSEAPAAPTHDGGLAGRAKPLGSQRCLPLTGNRLPGPHGYNGGLILGGGLHRVVPTRRGRPGRLPMPSLGSRCRLWQCARPTEGMIGKPQRGRLFRDATRHPRIPETFVSDAENIEAGSASPRP
jgi:hypothetical protein